MIFGRHAVSRSWSKRSSAQFHELAGTLARTNPCWALRRQARDRPSIDGRPFAPLKPVMQAESTIRPELDLRRHNTNAAPKWRARRIGAMACGLPGDLCISGWHAMQAVAIAARTMPQADFSTTEKRNRHLPLAPHIVPPCRARGSDAAAISNAARTPPCRLL